MEYKKLGLGLPKPTSVRLLTVALTVKKPIGILCDVLMKVDSFMFPANFMILGCEEDFFVHFILRRTFQGIGRELVNM